MVKRRSLDDALTPDEQSFLETGKTAKAEPKPKSNPEATSKKENSPMARTALKVDYAQQPSVPMPPPSSVLPQFTMAGAVSLNVRIEPEISTALLRASMDRKIQRLDPFTQRDIVADALADWLKKHGYLA
ncbi:MAG: hypothetical protein B7Z55_03120 [Planctomycetales bacterium 12-60-4]|nr:MAG: hypothetical protein B7Z55_03120 [Planctomycetales bacterium 12-60-4]